MSDYELAQIMDHLDYNTDKESLEMLRLNAFITAQVNSTKQMKLTDIVSFPWELKETAKMIVTDEEITRLRAKAQEIKQKLYGDNTNEDTADGR